MRQIIELLEDASQPEIIFCGDYESMKDQAIDKMKIAIYQAIEMLKQKSPKSVEYDEEIEQGKSALAWMRKQAQEIDPSVDDDEPVGICSRVISNAIPVEDDSVETIEIEGVRWYDGEYNCSYAAIPCSHNLSDEIRSKLTHSPSMKLICEISKDKHEG